METKPPRRSARIGLTGALSALVVVSLVVAGGVGFARSSVSAGQYQYGKKVTICHKGKVTITISRSALPAHLAHGDKLGPCKDAKKKKKAKEEAKEAKEKAEKAKEKAEKAKEKAEKAKEKAEKAKEKAEGKDEKAEGKKEKAEEKAEKDEKKGDDHGKSDEDHGKGQGPGKGKK